MEQNERKRLKAFYQDVLKNELLAFWLPRCVDEKNGGFLNCFTNDGTRLVSREKYTWSQGRFLWMWSKLAMLRGDTFTAQEKAAFRDLAKNGRDFLYQHCLLGEDDWRCTFLMEENGDAKYVDGAPALDMSISADGFVILGFAGYVQLTGDRESWEFVKKLYDSVEARYDAGNYYSLPYPLSDAYCSHSVPMMRTALANEMHRAAMAVEPGLAEVYRCNSARNSALVFSRFVDENGSLHEICLADGSAAGGIFGQHMNPGHTIEDMWFQLDSGSITGIDRTAEIARITKRAFAMGWDEEYGGILHFSDANEGGKPKGNTTEGAQEPQLKLVLGDWGSKLWWVHSEALYTTLRLYALTGDREFWELYKKTETYTFRTFPNPDRSVREWIQIRTRQGAPQDKVVALPVKDPFHIVRNVALILELLEEMEEKA